jgi:hypothetical protein
MGATSSSSGTMQFSESLDRLVGKEPMSLDDPSWNQSLGVHVAPGLLDSPQIKAKFDTLCSDLGKHLQDFVLTFLS